MMFNYFSILKRNTSVIEETISETSAEGPKYTADNFLEGYKAIRFLEEEGYGEAIRQKGEGGGEKENEKEEYLAGAEQESKYLTPKSIKKKFKTTKSLKIIENHFVRLTRKLRVYIWCLFD